MRLLRIVGLMLALLVLHAPSAFSEPITFTHQGTGSGTIAGNPFTNAMFTITALGDTNNRVSHSGGAFINHDTVSISITGVGNFLFTTPTRTFVNHSARLVGFSRASSPALDLFNGPTNPIFSTYNMLTSIGPVTGTGQLLQWAAPPPFLLPVLTTDGQLVFNNAATTATFTATVGQVIPEPTTLLLLGTGLAGVAAKVRKRRQARQSVEA